MNIEYELTILEIDVKDMEKRLLSLGAKRIGDFLQRRFVYDFNPKLPNKWVRLRTNGVKTTLTIKEVFDKTIIGGTNELEIEVSDFDKTNAILNELGYEYRSYQENRRIAYEYNEIEIAIDFWPQIPTYMEVEGKSEEVVTSFLDMLNLVDIKTTTKDVDSIYREIYGLNLDKFPKEVFLEEERKQC